MPWINNNARRIETSIIYFVSPGISKVSGFLYANMAERDHMNFGKAFEQVKQGKGMRLPQWKEDVVIRAQFPDEHSKMTAPYLYVESRYGRVPWKETMIELFSEEWEIVE